MKTLGQLFCDDSAEQIVNLLLAECEKGGVQIRLRSEIIGVERDDEGYRLQLNGDEVAAKKLVVASGGLSMRALVRRRLAINLPGSLASRCCRPVPGWCRTLHKPLLEPLQVLSGVSVPATITAENGTLFRENLLFTHRGLSGPAVLQISSYWQPGEFVTINLLPDCHLDDFLNAQRSEHPNRSLKNTLAMQLPKRLVECLQQLGQIPDVTLKQLSVREQEMLVETLTAWRVQPTALKATVRRR